MLMYLLLGCAAGIGALIRRNFTVWFKDKVSLKHGNWATFLINMVGIALIVVLFKKLPLNTPSYEILAVGGLGGLTTYSTFNSELVNFFAQKRYLHFCLYFVITYGLGFIIAWLIWSVI